MVISRGFRTLPLRFGVCRSCWKKGHRAELHLGIVSGSVEVVREAQGGSMVGNLVALSTGGIGFAYNHHPRKAGKRPRTYTT